jgi:argininosuccinate lyase
MAQGVSLRDLSLQDFQTVSSLFSDDVVHVLDFQHAIEQRDVPGGTATSSVQAQIKKAKTLLSKDS